MRTNMGLTNSHNSGLRAFLEARILQCFLIFLQRVWYTQGGSTNIKIVIFKWLRRVQRRDILYMLGGAVLLKLLCTQFSDQSFAGHVPTAWSECGRITVSCAGRPMSTVIMVIGLVRLMLPLLPFINKMFFVVQQFPQMPREWNVRFIKVCS